jgi:4-hydroxy 2-oxovalerate aldolase
MGIKILDCTLREGTHLTDGQFGEAAIVHIIENLSKSAAEIIEIGFLNDKYDTFGTTHFSSVNSAEKILERCDTKSGTEFSLMVRPDRFDVSTLKTRPEHCTIARIAFYQDDLTLAIDSARTLQSNGFDVFLNPIATSTYSDMNLATLATEANDLVPRGVNIVDTFGALTRERAREVYDILDDKLRPEITIGMHAHQNMGLSFTIAQDIVERKPESRDLIIDGSLYGMGRSPGNLPIELIAGFLNSVDHGAYDLSSMYAVLDEEIKDLKDEYDWGYSPEYYISAKHNVHRSYAERMKRDGAYLVDIEALCRSVSGGPYAVRYNEELVERYYDQ